MSMNPDETRAITVKLPAEAFEAHLWDPDGVAQELRTLWLLDLVRQRRMGRGKAAELAGMCRLDFLQLMARHQISPFDYDDDELAAELRA